jgi:cell wall-associated NlpC family hydrolase
VKASPGDIAVVRTKGWGAFLIRLGAWLRRKPHEQNHVVIVIDNLHTTVEAWPQGVREGSLDNYDAKTSLTNWSQPKTDAQRQAVVDVATSLLNHPYDWAAIARDTANVFDLDHKSRPWATDAEPSKFVCSSLADYVYFKVGLPCPGDGSETTPADWSEFIAEQAWVTPKITIPPKDPRTAIPGVMSPEPKG